MGYIRKTTEQFIAEFKSKFGDKYGCELVDYQTATTPIKMVCPIHGVFEQRPISLLEGHGCQKCGAEKNRRIIKTGDRFGYLTIIKEVESDRHNYGGLIRRFECKCDCGNIVIERLSTLRRRKDNISCGCIKTGFHTHSDTHTRIYGCWQSMKDRCLNPNCKAYKYYGGRGIKICDEWYNYELFRDWALENGYTEDLTIDRLDVNGNYEPSNCRWATMSEQQQNKRDSRLLMFKGVTKHVVEWSKETGVPAQTIWKRFIKYGESELIFSDEPIKSTKEVKEKIIDLYNKGFNYSQIARETGVSSQSIKRCLVRWKII